MSPSWIRKSAAATVLVTVVLTGSACGDDDDSGESAGAGGSITALCDAVRDADTRMGELFAASEQGGDAAKTATDELIAISDELLAAAPTALKPDYAVVRATFVGFAAELAEVDFDASQLPDGEAVAWRNPALAEATGRLDAYTVEHCDGASLGD